MTPTTGESEELVPGVEGAVPREETNGAPADPASGPELSQLTPVGAETRGHGAEPQRQLSGLAGAVTGERIEVRDSLVGVAAAGEMRANDSLIVVGAVGSLTGDARVLLTVPGALALGAGLGVALAVVGRLLRGRS